MLGNFCIVLYKIQKFLKLLYCFVSFLYCIFLYCMGTKFSKFSEQDWISVKKYKIVEYRWFKAYFGCLPAVWGSDHGLFCAQLTVSANSLEYKTVLYFILAFVFFCIKYKTLERLLYIFVWNTKVSGAFCIVLYEIQNGKQWYKTQNFCIVLLQFQTVLPSIEWWNTKL